MKQDIVIARVPCSAAGFQAEECQGWIERATSPDERHSCLLAAEETQFRAFRLIRILIFEHSSFLNHSTVTSTVFCLSL